MVFLVSLTFYEVIADAFPKLKNRYVVGGLIITSSGLLMDLSLDPIATRFHWWVWNDDLLPVWFGVPLINYVAWFWAVLVFGAFWIWIHNKFPGDSDEDNKNQIKWLVYMLFPMWLIDTMGVMATRMFMEIGQVMYKTPYTFHWEVWHPVAILGIVLGIVFSIRYFYLEFKMKNKKNSTRT
ncbi:MAG: carotenoid biosynthesis protein [Promethearchaeota archaeon]